MAELTYLDFDLTIAKSGTGGYKIKVKSAGGDPSSDFASPFQPEELGALRSIVEGPAREVGAISAPRIADLGARLRLFGERLYEAVFLPDIRAALASCLVLAQQKNGGVRIRLHLDEAPELAGLPWEFLYDRAEQAYLSLSELTPIIRHMSLKGPASAQLVKPPIRMLVMISAPRDHSKLDVEKEWRQISEALKELQSAKLVALTRVTKASLPELQKCLQKQSYHVFHFIGHGGFDSATNGPALMFEDDDGNSTAATRDDLKTALKGHTTMRLVVLNSCEGARADGTDPFAGMAQGLVLANLPAVIAMQFKITDKGAIKFAGELYNAIANNLPIDNALAEARKAMFFARNPTEWGTPVLFMRGDDGRIFQIDQPTEEQQRQMQIKALSDDAHAAIDARQYAVAIQKLTEIVKLTQAGPAAIL